MRYEKIPAALAALVSTLLLSAASQPAQAGGAGAKTSPDGLWTLTASEQDAVQLLSLEKTPKPKRYKVYAIDAPALQELLHAVPLEATLAAAESDARITLPMPDGSFARFRIVESPILGPKVQELLPGFRTYLAQGLDDRTATARLDMGPRGFHGMILSEAGSVFIDPVERDRTDQVISAWKHDFPPDPAGFDCLSEGATGVLPAELHQAVPPSGTQLRTYRLGLIGTDEWFCYFDNGFSCTTGIGRSRTPGGNAMATMVNRVTGIFEKEAAIRLQFDWFQGWYVDGGGLPLSDPFPTGTTVDAALLNQNQTQADAVGLPYDIGHIVSAGGIGGLAQSGVCAAANKAKGGTSRSDPTGDPFDVDFVAHEMGHQFSAGHTFNGTNGSCAGNQLAGWRMEPGGGTTIMGYAGICGADNIQPHSDPYFHVKSLEDIIGYRGGTGGTCGTVSATGNTPPVVNAGPDGTIPRGTAFSLVASGSDANGDALTYTWEQYDDAAPLFRSISPSSGGYWRYMPDLGQILSGASDPWEVLPATDRTMHFRATVRDNRAGGGGVDDDDIVVTVSGAPFFVTYPNGGEFFAAGQEFTATWNVGGSVAPTVYLWLYDAVSGAFTPLTSTANDGSEVLRMPCGLTSPSLRLWIDTGATPGVHFMDVSNANFTLVDGGGSADFTPYQPAGWGDTVVVRPTADATAASAPLPASLTGDATSYFSWTYANTGSAWGCGGGFTNEAHLDERTVSTPTSSPAPGTLYQFWNYAVTVSGGRHTAWQVSDRGASIAESNESNNGYARQWVWAPPSLSGNTQVVRATPPPDKNAGRSYIPVATPSYDNVDGFRILPSVGFWRLIALSNTSAAADYDLRLYATSSGVASGFDGAILASSAAGAGVTDGILMFNDNEPNIARDMAVLNFNTNTSGYRLEYRESSVSLGIPGAAAGNNLALNQVAWVGEFFVDPGQIGNVTMQLTNVTTGQPVTFALYDRTFTKGALTGSLQSTSVAPDGTATMTRSVATSGYYGLTVYRNAKDGTAPFTFDLNVCVSQSWYRDVDGDGHGVPGVPIVACVQPSGYAPNASDCNDANAAVYPGAAEVCDSLDNNCDTFVDNGAPPPTGVPTLTAQRPAPNTIRLSWSSVPGATGYDIVRGTLSTLRSTGGNFTAAALTCLAGNQGSTSLDENASTPVGDGFWYLTRATGCGGAATYDSSPLSHQVGLRDAEIQANGSSCP